MSKDQTTQTTEENRQWVLDRLARSFMRQGFGPDESWRRANLLVEDQPHAE